MATLRWIKSSQKFDLYCMASGTGTVVCVESERELLVFFVSCALLVDSNNNSFNVLLQCSIFLSLFKTYGGGSGVVQCSR